MKNLVENCEGLNNDFKFGKFPHLEKISPQNKLKANHINKFIIPYRDNKKWKYNIFKIYHHFSAVIYFFYFHELL